MVNAGFLLLRSRPILSGDVLHFNECSMCLVILVKNCRSEWAGTFEHWLK